MRSGDSQEETRSVKTVNTHSKDQKRCSFLLRMTLEGYCRCLSEILSGGDGGEAVPVLSSVQGWSYQATAKSERKIKREPYLDESFGDGEK